MNDKRNYGDENEGGEEPFYESDGDEYVPYIPESKHEADGSGQQDNYLSLSKSYLESIPTKMPKQKEPGELTLYEDIKLEIDIKARQIAEKAHRNRMEHQPYGPHPEITYVQVPRQERMGAIGRFIFRPGIRGMPGMPLVPRRPRVEYTEHSDKNGYPRMTKAFKRYKKLMLRAESAKQKRDREVQKKALDELTNLNEAFGKTAL